MRDKAFNIAKNPKYDGYQRGLPSVVSKFFDEETSAIRAQLETLAIRATRNKIASYGIKNEKMSKKELTEELHKQIIRKF